MNAVHPDDRAYAERQWREAVAVRGLVDAEFRLRSPDGGWRWTNVRATPLIDEKGRIEKWVGMNTDIDDRKQSEDALRESEERFRTMADNAPVLIWETDQHGAIAVNAHYTEFFGVDLEQILAMGWTAFLHPDDAQGYFDAYRKAFEQRTVYTYECRLLRADGQYRWLRSTGGPVGRNRFIGCSLDVTDLLDAQHVLRDNEIALREREERQAFLLMFADALRAEPNMETIAYRAIGLLSEQLALDRCYITYYRPDEDEADFPYQVGNATVPPLPPKVKLSDFPDAYQQVLEKTFVMEDDFERRGLSEAERENSEALGMRAMLASTIRQGERNPLSSMVAVSSRPRRWTVGEIALVEEAAERTWSAMERARAEDELRESQARFQQFANASAAGMWIRDAETLAMEYVSPAIARIYGVEPDTFLGDMKRWAALILPEDREVALGHISAARHGEAVVHEFRIQRPDDGTFHWIRNTDFPLFDPQGRVQRIGGLAEDITQAKLLTEHQRVLLAELQHRVRNIMAMIRSTAVRSADGAGNVEDYKTSLAGRLLALARVQTLLTREANAGGSLRSVLESEINAQAHSENQYELTGPDIMLSPKAVEVLTLAFHELSTNALKYGALSVSNGKITVRWTRSKNGRSHGSPLIGSRKAHRRDHRRPVADLARSL